MTTTMLIFELWATNKDRERHRRRTAKLNNILAFMSFVNERDNTQAAGEQRHQSDGDEKS